MELDKGALSPAEATAFAELFEQVIWYSPFPEERAKIPNDRSEEDIARAAEVAARHLGGKSSKRASSEDLATLIVDALVDGGVVKKEDLQRAIEIVTEEIEVRKALGDY